ncbi:MAG: helix-turn-helix domain-containing protein [Eubacterium sp.]|nr:helix-turn-helix domain-containing protein [Eubacterium sp.]MDE6155321.1 helix-turn-helix domain-containing protein [Eubacterium sp.]
MTKETANRLFQYRKANGYSQEELAAQIGVSRQAISKWERGESSPDTDNLITLAKLYDITIDELINGTDEVHKSTTTGSQSSSEESTNNETADKEDSDKKVSFVNGIHVHDGKDKVDISFSGIHIETKNGESVHIGSRGVEVDGIGEDHIFKYNDSKHPWFHAILPAAVIIAYLIIGFTFDKGWALGWLLIFLIPIAESFIAAVKTKNPSAFAYPVLVVTVYLTVGMFMSIWHPTWIMFLTIPIYYIIADALKPKKDNQN